MGEGGFDYENSIMKEWLDTEVKTKNHPYIKVPTAHELSGLEC